jgi:hypothetical protein
VGNEKENFASSVSAEKRRKRNRRRRQEYKAGGARGHGGKNLGRRGRMRSASICVGTCG